MKYHYSNINGMATRSTRADPEILALSVLSLNDPKCSADPF